MGTGRRAAATGAVLAVVAGGAGAAALAAPPELTTSGPVGVSGTDGTGVFTVGERTVRQVRYDDQGTLRYTFRVHNPGRLPVRVEGLAAGQSDPRLFDVVDLTAATVPGGGDARVTLTVAMNGCESLSSRSGSFVDAVVVRTRRVGVVGDEVVLGLPEELHTGSPREAFCPRSSASSRPQG